MVKCEFYEPKSRAKAEDDRYINVAENCTTCDYWGNAKCKEEEFMRELYKDTETKKLMGHDSFKREHGSVRQVRRGT